MNSDTNLAPWMIAGGPRTPDVAAERDLGHRRALASARRTLAGPGITARFSASLAAFLTSRTEPQPACCPA